MDPRQFKWRGHIFIPWTSWYVTICEISEKVLFLHPRSLVDMMSCKGTEREGFACNILLPDKSNQHTPTHVQHVTIRSRFGVQETDALLISTVLCWLLCTLTENVIRREPQALPRVCGRSSGGENASYNFQNKGIFIHWRRLGLRVILCCGCVLQVKTKLDCHMQHKWHLSGWHLTEIPLNM